MKLAVKRLPRRESALLRLLKGTGIKPKQVENAPNLSSILGKRHGDSWHVPPSVIDSMRFSQEEAVVKFLRVYDAIPADDRKQIPFEAVALKAECNFNELLGAAILSFRSIQSQKSAVLAMGSHPEVVEATIRDAVSLKGTDAQRILHTAVGFLPTPKGASINFNLGQNNQETPDENQVTTEPDMDHLFPRIVKKQEEWQLDRTHLLESGD